MKCVKLIPFLVAVVLSVPFLLAGLMYKLAGKFYHVALLAAYLPFGIGEKIRLVFYKVMLEEVGKNVRFKFGSYCQYPDCRIGDNVTIGLFTSIGIANIGNDVLFGANVNVLSGRHQHPTAEGRKEGVTGRERITIGNNVWIGSNAVIMADVGTGVTIGAGSVLVKKAADGKTVVGNPAREIMRVSEGAET